MGKKLWTAIVLMVLALTLVACSGDSKTTGGSGDKSDIKIGIAMPTKDLQRWTQDGDNMEAAFKEEGYQVDRQYANNNIGTQLSQIENMITGGCDVLVIAPIDGNALGPVLEKAKEADIPVIAYDRLIMESDAVTYYATFDNYKVGQIQGQYIEEALDLENQDGPFNIELFTGPTDDNNTYFFFDGAMDVLQPYIDDGTLVVVSGQTELAEVSTLNWSTEEAQKRMENIITGFYADGTELDAVLSSNDSVAHGIANALLGAGYEAGNFPIITGQDCDITSVKNIISGTQAMSVFKDTRTLASSVVDMVNAIAADGEVPVNDTETYDNGTGVIPTFLSEPVFADINNYEEILIDSGYYTEDQLK